MTFQREILPLCAAPTPATVISREAALLLDFFSFEIIYILNFASSSQPGKEMSQSSINKTWKLPAADHLGSLTELQRELLPAYLYSHWYN